MENSVGNRASRAHEATDARYSADHVITEPRDVVRRSRENMGLLKPCGSRSMDGNTQVESHSQVGRVNEEDRARRIIVLPGAFVDGAAVGARTMDDQQSRSHEINRRDSYGTCPANSRAAEVLIYGAEAGLNHSQVEVTQSYETQPNKAHPDIQDSGG